MTTVSGIFEGLVAKPGVGKKPPHKPYTMYSVQVAGKKYGIGFNPVKAATGDTVTFETEQNDRGYEEANPATFRVVAAATPASNAAAQAVSPAVVQSSTNHSIESQVALKAAVEFAIAAGKTEGADVAKLFAQFQGLLQPKPAVAKATPKKVELEHASQDPDDFDSDQIPY